MNSNWSHLVLADGPAGAAPAGTEGTGPGAGQAGMGTAGGTAPATGQTGTDTAGGTAPATGQTGTDTAGGTAPAAGQAGTDTAGGTAPVAGQTGTGTAGGTAPAAGQAGTDTAGGTAPVAGQTGTGTAGGTAPVTGQAGANTVGGTAPAAGQTGTNVPGETAPATTQPATEAPVAKKPADTNKKTNTGSSKKTTAKTGKKENTEKQQTEKQQTTAPSEGQPEASAGSEGLGGGAGFGPDVSSLLGKSGEGLQENGEGQAGQEGQDGQIGGAGGQGLLSGEDGEEGADGQVSGSEGKETEGKGAEGKGASETGEGASGSGDGETTVGTGNGSTEVPADSGSFLSRIDVGRTAVAAALAVAVLAALVCFVRSRKKTARSVKSQAGGETKKLEVEVPPAETSGAGSPRGDASLSEASLPPTRETEKAGEGRVLVSKVHDIGRRESQQDAFGVSDLEDPDVVGRKGVFAVVADGMGGLVDSGEVSAQVTLSMIRYFYDMPLNGAPDQELLQMLSLANEEVNRRLGPEGQRKSGSTVVAVWLRGRDLYWIAVGDSHIYLYRNSNLMQVNREHVYGVVLDEKAARGELSFSEAQNDPQRKALTSFVGMGRLEKIDRNIRPLQLMPGDRVVLMSDGVFGVLSDEEMELALSAPVGESASILDQMVRSKNVRNQDNYTAVILEYR